MNGMNRIRNAALFGAGAVAFAITAVGAQSTSIPRTPWGDPDIQGTYTNSNESGIPMERPAEFAGRRPDDVKPEELAKLIQQRAHTCRGDRRGHRRHAGGKHRRRTEALVRELPGDEQPALDDLGCPGRQDAGDDRRRQGGARRRYARRGAAATATTPARSTAPKT